jgi:hypothetical protein
VRHLVWAAVIVGAGLLGAVVSVAGGSWFMAALSGAAIGLGVGFTWMGWRLERKSDRRLAELVARAYGYSNRNGGAKAEKVERR